MNRWDLQATAPTHSGFGPLSIRTHLLLLISAVLLPMLVLAAILAWNFGVSKQERIAAERLDVADDMSALIDREVKSRAGFLSGVGMAPAFRAGQADTVEAVTALALERGFLGLGLFEANGRARFVSPQAMRPAFVRPEALGLAEVVAGRSLFVSNLLAIDDGKPSVYVVSVPVTLDGKVAFVLSGALSAASLQSLFAEAGLPDAWTASIVDRAGLLLARSQRPEAFVGLPAQAAMAEAAKGGQKSGQFDVVSLEGVAVKNTFLRSRLTGWTSDVAVPSAVVNAPLWRSMLGMLVLGVALTLIALFLATLVANRITRAVHQLGRAAVAFAAGDVVPVQVSATAHVEDVSQALEAAASTANLARPTGDARRRD
jgi:hypothetical protein